MFDLLIATAILTAGALPAHPVQFDRILGTYPVNPGYVPVVSVPVVSSGNCAYDLTAKVSQDGPPDPAMDFIDVTMKYPFGVFDVVREKVKNVATDNSTLTHVSKPFVTGYQGGGFTMTAKSETAPPVAVLCPGASVSGSLLDGLGLSPSTRFTATTSNLFGVTIITFTLSGLSPLNPAHKAKFSTTGDNDFFVAPNKAFTCGAPPIELPIVASMVSLSVILLSPAEDAGGSVGVDCSVGGVFYTTTVNIP